MSIALKRLLLARAMRRSLECLLLCASVAGSHAPVAAQTAPDSLTSAATLIREGSYDPALRLIQHALKTRPSDFRLLTLEGIAFSLKGDDGQALACLHKALVIAPEFPRALQAEASILSRRRDPKVIPVLRSILRVVPQDSTAHEMLALAFAQQEQCREALQEFAVAGAVVSQHAESLQQKAACLLSTKDFAGAIQAFHDVTLLRPGDRGAMYDLALAEFDAGDVTSAATVLTPLLDKAADLDTLLLAADVFEQKGDTPQAAATLRRAIVLDPMRSESYVRFAELCMAHESYQAGVDMVSAGMERVPANSSLLLARGLLLGGMAKYDEAEADFRAAQSRDPGHGTGSYAIGLIQKQRNDPAQALATVRTALAAHPEDGQLHLLLARLLTDSGTGFSAEATREAQEAVRLSPNLVAGRNMLASLYQSTGKPALAVEQAKAALALDPTDSTALYRLMRSLRALGRNEEAHAMGEQVAEQLRKSREEETKRLSYRIERAPQGSVPPTYSTP